ncbi:hypothetical protein [Burkholderia singularis]|uniref:Uncharacterized protein n=1 Tax=Burkholderia singularis TaxID=1503053 RepID=A0A238GYQ5_9BURK|nr:hypothetical protein [Burkholderia singularis]SMF98116.1 FIG00455141: hypothetical protein [Burkholderia singularis]
MRFAHRLLRIALCGLATSPAFAGASGSAPLILDTQSGIHDGRSGVVSRNVPLSSAPIVEPIRPAPMRALPSAATAPMVIIPYIEVPGAPAPYTAPVAQPRD